ncbi:putative F-box protein PP2-B12 [Lycium ferocissimum]|uniref:putative F-box protein PP2-B12 n=1 Tax=Lycium ferocissimum TaxID=112874 RepID=UPI002815FE54|nr:putative F-box protein PP2-B12 [Lycium ferocissimum]
MEKEKGEEDGSPCLWMLPEACLDEILALTRPRDVCRLSLVSPSLRSAANSDSVWAKFLPSDYRTIIAGSPTPIPYFRSLRDLYVYLSHHPLLIDEGRKSFSLEKTSGKKCYFLGARDLNIAWADTPGYWEWTSLPESRFTIFQWRRYPFLEIYIVTQLKFVWWLQIWGTIRTGLLSPLTFYRAYFVYKFKDGYGFDYRPSEVSVRISGAESKKRFAFLHPDGEQEDWTLPSDAEYEGPGGTPPLIQGTRDPRNSTGILASIMQDDKQLPKLRDDGWFELELGEFFTENEDDCIEMKMQEPQRGFPKRGLIVEGIEIRPIVY